jgi:hypothetical protein
VLRIDNHGPLIVATNYWDTDHAVAGKLYLSCNGGAFRLLVPPAEESLLAEIRTATAVIVSRGPWPEGGQADAIELLFEDGSQSPYAIHLSVLAVDRLPADIDQGQPWLFTAWTSPRRGRPHKAYERPAWYRVVNLLPCLQPYERSFNG